MTSEPTLLWDSAEAAERWQRTAVQRQQAVGAVTELMLDSVGLAPGFRVLDLAAGTGDTSILAARRVGPTGSVLAVDISTAMLQEAAAAATREGLTNVQTLVSDIEWLDLPPHTFDAAISRFGLMFLSDVVEGLRRIGRALKPGARLAAMVWSTEQRNPYISIPLALAEQFGRAPQAGPPTRRAVSLGGPGVFDGALRQAGFTGVSIQAVPTPRQFDSADAAVESIQQTSATLRELMGGLDASKQPAALAQLRQRLSEFAGADGRCVVPGEALIAVANAP
jgi:ubiquinone/menaquinone biosynthesis C-methylase UbiE